MKATAVSPITASFGQHPLERAGGPFENRPAGVIRKPVTAPSMRVTRRQLEVLCLLCEGLPNKLIARRLNISPATVKAHIGCILRGLGVASRLQAVVAARRLALMSESTCGSRQPGESALARQTAMLRLFDEMATRQLAAAPQP